MRKALRAKIKGLVTGNLGGNKTNDMSTGFLIIVDLTLLIKF